MPSGQKPPVSPFAQEVSRIIRGHLARIGWTHAELGQKVGISSSQVSRMLRGDRHMDVDQFARICSVLRLDPAKVVAEAWEVSRGYGPAAAVAELRERLDMIGPPDDREPGESPKAG